MRVKVLKSIGEEDQNALKEQFAIDILKGFTAPKKYISSKYFYDDRGSELFSKITTLEEYYPTRAEAEVLERSKLKLSNLLKDQSFNLIELGAGDGQKTKILIEQLLKDKRDFEYKPIDISKGAIEDLSETMKSLFPELKFTGIVGEYLDGINWTKDQNNHRNVVLFLGSNIGNFDHAAASVFLRILWNSLNKGDLIIVGFDQKKDIDQLLWAYNDSKGITKEFNLNLLRRMNNELGANFILENFMHFGTYNPHKGAMESYLISKTDQNVRIEELKKSFHFKAFEAVHLEYSYKYLPHDIEKLASDTDYEVLENFYDSKKYFIDSLWKVVK